MLNLRIEYELDYLREQVEKLKRENADLHKIIKEILVALDNKEDKIVYERSPEDLRQQEYLESLFKLP